MIYVKLMKNNVLINRADFNTLSEANDWISNLENSEEYQVVIEDVTTQMRIEKEKNEALAYLAATDFYIIREIDSGVPCPAEIKALRAAARLKV